MIQKKSADRIGPGEEFAPYEFLVTPEFNRQYCEAVEDDNPRYFEGTDLGPPIVHASLLIHHNSVTRSPSFYLPPGVTCIYVKGDVQYLNLARVGKKLTSYWKVLDLYQRHGRPYQVDEAKIVDEDGVEILRRKTTYTYISGGG